ncbi:MAG: peptide-methionine (R)-S-oxide reductase MsrB [Gammaproteobacteria bacterium]|nr:peptide-methionine (R)-S-oxide reductase MsrB [Gammaproteobacteria bacterium]
MERGIATLSNDSTKTKEQWLQQLTPEQYRITREHGTEPAFSGKYHNCKTPGIYQCICCGARLFSSETKYDSGSGWPSFWQPLEKMNILEKKDASLGMTRTEVLCAKCQAHLGHVFEDGPNPTGLRYCINSASLKLVEKKK